MSFSSWQPAALSVRAYPAPPCRHPRRIARPPERLQPRTHPVHSKRKQPTRTLTKKKESSFLRPTVTIPVLTRERTKPGPSLACPKPARRPLRSSQASRPGSLLPSLAFEGRGNQKKATTRCSWSSPKMMRPSSRLVPPTAARDPSQGRAGHRDGGFHRPLPLAQPSALSSLSPLDQPLANS